ncbi:MAG: flagellar hook-associated protein FlgK [Ferrimicrobium sp.]
MSGGALYIALSGIEASQTGLDVVSQNVSNANTPGYLSQTTNLSNQVVPGSPVGNGVTVSSIGQAASGFIRQIELAASGANAYAGQLSSVLTSAQNSFMEPSAAGVAEQLNTMWSTFSALSNTPNEPAAQAQVVVAANSVAIAINQSAQQLNDLYNQTSATLGSIVANVNTQLGQVAGFNQQIAGVSNANGGANSIVDQRNQVLDQLATELGVSVVPSTSGMVNVMVGGIPLVQGVQASTIKASTGTAPPMPSANAASVSVVGSGVLVPVSLGSLGAMLGALNSSLPTYGGYLDNVASTLASTVNTQLESGTAYPSSGATPGVALFVNSTTGGTSGINSLNLSVSQAVTANPSLIAAATGSNGPGDGSNAAAVATLETSNVGPNALWSKAVGQVGLDVSSAANLATSASATYQQAYQAEQKVSGVNVNAQLVNMVTYQQGYQAAAKVISTVVSAVQSLLQAV